jgi:hypothetical protein
VHWLGEQVLVVREIRLVLIVCRGGLVEVGDEWWGSADEEFSHFKRMADSNNVLHLDDCEHS